MAYTTAKVIAIASVGTLVIAATTVEVVHITQSAPAPAHATTEVAAIAPDVVPPTIASTPAPQPSVGSFVYVMGNVARPGVYQMDARHLTVDQILGDARIDPELLDTGWITIIRRVGPKSVHTLAMPIARFLNGDAPAEALTLHPNDVYNITVAAPPFQPTASRTDTIKIAGNISKPGDYSIFGKNLSLTDTLTQFAGVTPAQFPNLVVSVGHPKEDNSIQYFAQYKMADIISGKSDTYYPSPGQTLLVQTIDTAMSPKDIVLPFKFPAPIPADRPSTPEGTYEVRGEIVRAGIFPFQNQTLTARQVAVFKNLSDQFGIITLTRKVEGAPDKIITIDIKAIADGTAPDYVLQDDDVVKVHKRP